MITRTSRPARHLLGVALLTLAHAHATAETPAPSAFISPEDVSWKTNAFAVARWKTLVGGIEGGQLPARDVQFGQWELAPGAVYHGHRHAVPELYVVLEGSVRWQVGEETRDLGPGDTVLTPPNAVHRMENLGDTPVRTLWFWWAPGGDASVFAAPYEFTEPPVPAPPGVGYDDAERLHAASDG